MRQVTDAITHDELARVLELQTRAYETLIWLSHIAFARPEMLGERTADAMRDPQACRAWVKRFHDQLPARLRPATDEDAEPFALLFSSFFQTSFRIEQRLHDGKPYYVIAVNKDAASRRDKLAVRTVPRRVKHKRRGQAESLQHQALLALNGGRNDADFWVALGAATTDTALHKHLLVWTYARELVARSRGAAHGPAVHEIWKQIGRDTRERLSADRVVRSRERLEQLLRDTRARST